MARRMLYCECGRRMRKSCKSELLVVIDEGKHMVHGVCEDPLCQCRVCDTELLDELPCGAQYRTL